ncbi:PEP-CTERM sorting domain-containing protein [Psychrobium sp. 1_MG-2023]|uniref:PEP-CTERM sorting domain-containing protein n=1 Tax=Psychrobium sp. 1_MG-2023 TaxID=3062624 RepID=UPI000C32637E|nr:PEP-CTERM sorting domain-containing protein [Psychrobium sp. 1_MG-2023]MDP2561773.1 PEP-CTERM sorting domain-containing protein [Psychrobium sp. 1_MG-2023]PKF59743.1 hypothetical protein CW748_00645 [Alteromonadales bacterium alter-6D02]
MKTNLIKKLSIASGMLAASMFSVNTLAGEMITLDFDSGFLKSDVVVGPDTFLGVDSNPIFGNTTAGNTIAGHDTYTFFDWDRSLTPTPSAFSSLKVENFSGLMLDTDIINTPVTLQLFTQVNNVIPRALEWDVGIINQLKINTVIADTAFNNIHFKETINSSPCADGSPSGLVCDDIYTVNDISAVIPVYVNGTHAKIRIWVDPVDPVVCNDNGATLDCFTPEEVPGTTQIAVKAELIAIPEPGVLALIGLGLVGLGFGRRKRS